MPWPGQCRRPLSRGLPRPISEAWLSFLCPQKLCHGGVSRLADPFTPPNGSNGEHQNSQVQPDAPMVDVPDVKSKPLLPRQRVAAMHLCPACNPGLHFVPAALERAVAREVLHQQRTRTHQAEFAFQDIPELRKFVEAQPPQNLSQRC